MIWRGVAIPRVWLSRPLPLSRFESLAGLLLLLLLGFGLRTAGLERQSLWHDEVSGVVNSLRSLPVIATWVATSEPHPPLSYFFLHLWMQAGGTSEYAVRYLSVVFGSLSIAAMYGLLRQVVSRPGALLGSAAMAVSALHVYYSQEARMHVLACLLGIVAAWTLLAAEHRPSLLRWTAYSVASIATLYTFYFSALVLLAINLPALADRRRRTRGWWLANLAAIAAWLPWLASVAALSSRFVTEPLPGGPAASPLVSALHLVVGWAFGVTAELASGSAPAIILLALVLASAGRLWLRARFAGRLLALWAVLPPVGILVATFAAVGAVDTAPRLALICLPAWIAVVVAGWPGITAMPRLFAMLAIALYALPTALALAANYTQASRDDYRAVFATIRREALPTEALVYDVADQVAAFRYYFPDDKLATFGLPGVRSQQQTDSTLEQIGNSHDGVWAVLYAEPVPWVEQWLDDHLLPASNRWYGPYVRLKHYLPAPLAGNQGLPDGIRVGQAFGPLELRQVRLAAALDPQSIPLEMLWRATGPVSSDYHRSLQLFDAQGHRVAQLDTEPAEGTIPTSHWKPSVGYRDSAVLHPDVPLASGEYLLQAAVYDSDGTTFQLQPVLRLARLTAERSVVLRAVASTGWTLESVTLGGGPDGELLVALEGSVQAAIPASYSWFVHLLDGQGRVVGQDDHAPISPTTSWLPGDRFSDVFRLPAAGAQGLSIELGAYDTNGRRAAFTLSDGSSADHLTVPLAASG